MSVLSAWIALVGGALAAEVLLYAPEGPPVPGAAGPVEVVVVDGPRVVEGADVTVVTGTGAPVASEGEVAPGRYRFRYEAPADERVATLVVRVPGVAPASRTLPLAAPPVPAFDAPSEVEAAVGTPRIELRFPRRRAAVGAPDALLARVSEGRVLEVRAEPEAVVVAVEPGAERTARVMAVGLVDLDDPQASPTFGLVRLRARPQLTLTAEPGSKVTVRVGRRSYGPFVADASGAANLAFDAWPGESTYEISVADDLGNTQRSQGPLPSSTRPVLVGIEAPRGGDHAADVWLGAWSPTGAPWTGAAPLCRSGAGGRAEAATAGKGIYRAGIEAPGGGGAFFDPRVECALADASVALRVPFGAERPDRIELRVYPDALSADFPIAEVQAALLDRRGERLPADALRLLAEVGELELQVTDGAVRGEYRGAAAVERGGDVLTAAWDHPVGGAVPWSLSLAPGVDAEGFVALVRALDRRERPVAGAPVRVRLGEQLGEAVTDARGWARLRFPTPPGPTTVRAEAAAGIVREAPWVPGHSAPLPDPAAPDLVARVELPIRAGRVRQVFLDVEPRPLLTGTGTTGTVVVRMLDGAGNPVRDEPVTIGASEGEVSPAEPQADGSLKARYTPPAGLVDRTVRITATTSAGTVATDLQLAPRPVTGGVGLSAGWISNFGVVSAPTLSVGAFRHVPKLPRIVGARVGVSAFALATVVDDADADETIAVRATFVPFDVGVQVLERWGRRSLHAGIAAVITPYTLAIDYGELRGTPTLGLASPGLSVYAGGGYRLGSSELFVEGRYLLFTAGSSQLAFEGSVGGLSLTAGYRLLY